MILYLDTSALLKAYVRESDSALVRGLLAAAAIVSSHMIAFVEANAAFARLGREGILTATELGKLRREFAADWKNYLQVGLDQRLLDRASDLAGKHALRAYDSLHLASAELLAKEGREPLLFACFDRNLNRAAGALGMAVAVEV